MMAILRGLLFAAFWLLIVGISAHDGLLTLANRPVMAIAERNPVGTILIRWNGGDVWLLLAAKAAGTIAAAALLLLLLYRTHPAIGWLSCAGIAAFQVGLLLFLYMA